MLGIDISSTTVKLLELSAQDGGYRVEGYSVASVPQGAVFEKNINNVGEVATAIRSVVHQSRTRATNAVAAVAGSSVITKTIVMPTGLTDDELETQIALEADQYIPYPLEEVAIDFEVQGLTAGRDDQIDVLLAACRRDHRQPCRGARAGRLEPSCHGCRSLCDGTCFRINKANGWRRCLGYCCVVDIGATMTTLSVLHQGENVHTRANVWWQTANRRNHATLRPAIARGGLGQAGGLPDEYGEEVLMPLGGRRAAGRPVRYSSSTRRRVSIPWIIFFWRAVLPPPTV